MIVGSWQMQMKKESWSLDETEVRGYDSADGWWMLDNCRQMQMKKEEAWSLDEEEVRGHDLADEWLLAYELEEDLQGYNLVDDVWEYECRQMKKKIPKKGTTWPERWRMSGWRRMSCWSGGTFYRTYGTVQ